MPPMMPSLALVVLRAIRSPSGTEMITVTPCSARSTASPTAWVIIARGTGLMAGPPTLEPEARLGDDAHAHAAVQLEARLVAPAHGGGQLRAVGHVRVVAGVLDHHRPRPGAGSSVQASTGKRTRWPSGRPTSTRAAASAWWPARWWPPWPRRTRRSRWSSRCAAPCFRTFAVRGRSGSRSSGSAGSRPCSLVSRSCFLAWGSAFAVPVEVAGVVQVRAGACCLQRRADQDQRVLPELALLDGGGQGIESACG